MDPFDPTWNGEGSACSRRRVSSILKAPRKSYIASESEQQENRVECTKTVEKRISRRVSFAATNNVLLFSNDAKSDSAATGPLQDLMITPGTQRRTQVAFTEDLNQQAAKETLMRASLHASERWDKGNFDTRDNVGEKTVMFGTDDAFMDMTQSHSVHLATGAELFSDISLHNNETASREKTQIFAADDGSMDMTLSHTSKMVTVPGFLPSLESNVENKSTSSSVVSLDADFEDFLASLFKPSSSSANPEDARAAASAGTSSEAVNSSLLQMKAPKCHVDKENQPPAHLMEKSLKASRKRGPSSGSGAVDATKAGDEFMDMTQSHTVTVTGGPLAPPTHSQARGAMRRISTQEEKQKETRPMPSTKCPDFGFKAALAGVSTTSGPGSSPDPPARMKTSSVSFLNKGDAQAFNAAASAGGGVGREDDVTMDMTEAQTRFITGWNDDNVFPPSQSQDDHEIPEKPSSSNSAALKMKTHEHKFKFDAEDGGTDNMVRFSGEDACMDVTESCTGRIAIEVAAHDVFAQSCDVKKVDQTLGQRRSLALRPSCFRGTETMLTAASKSKVYQVRPHADELTVRFSADDACMDVTQCQTVNIVRAPDAEAPQNSDSLSPCRDRTVTFSANAADMDVTQCLTGNIAADRISDAGTVTLPADMDVTQCQTDGVASHWETNSVPQKRDSLFLYSRKERSFPFCAEGGENQTDCPPGKRPSTGRALNPGFKSLSKRSATWANPVLVKAATATPASADSADAQLQDCIAAKIEPPRLIPAVTQNLESVTVANTPEEAAAEAQCNSTLGPERADEPPRRDLSAQASPSCSVATTETEATAPRKIGSPGLAAPSRESKRMSLADLQSKVRRLSRMVNAAPAHTAPSPQLENDLDLDSKGEPQPASEPEVDVASGEREGDAQASCSTEEDQTAAAAASATPFKLKSAELVSRLSMGGFKPRLPQRAKANDAGKAAPVGGHARTAAPGGASELPGLDCNVSDLYDEELGSCDDVSETLETGPGLESPPRMASETAGASQELAAEDEVFQEGRTSDTNMKKRPLTSDEDNEEQKKKRASTEMAADIDMDLQPHQGEIDSNVAPAACVTTVDEYSSSHTASCGYEATFESTWKQSLFESHVEDYADDMQNKFDDGTITVKEFFKIFHIDFVIHNSRQSVLPERLSDAQRTPMDLLKDRYICRPRQQVYEKDVLSLTEKVDGLRGRMQDLDRPLQIVSRSLWEEICSFSEEELRSFGAKLKERNNLFRKRSKAQSHEMKEVLYANIVQANEEVQQSLRAKIDEADEMIKSLDDCIDELKTELTAVEEKGSEDLPSLKWCQGEMERVTVALADRERQTFELENQNEQNAKKLDKLKTETKNLQSHISTLHLLTEWRLGESSDHGAAFTFLYKTFHLQVVYENGNVADKPSERKIIKISFKHEIDEEKTKDCGRLVHKLLSQYTEGERAWVEKYPTGRHLPMLLQDVSLVVSSCRLLGEELRLLNTWGGMSFAILGISCVDTRVHFVFSSLKNLSKFEVTFSTSLTEEAYALNVQSFKNKYGSTTVQQIEEIVASFSPCKNLLTKIVKKIHGSLLC